MMASTLGLPFAGPVAYPYPSYTTDALLDDLSKQISTSPVARRLSRGSSGQRSGTAMRITKPSSASNSPRSSISLYKRRTFLNDGSLARRGQQVMDQIFTPLPPPNADFSTNVPAPRPVSWHPASSHYQQPPVQLQPPPATQYQTPAHSRAHGVDVFPHYHHQMSPMTTSYSCHTSPRTFSPLNLPLNDFNATQHDLHHEAWNLQSQSTPSYVSPDLESRLSYAESFAALSSAASTSNGSRSSSTTEWNSFVLHGFDRTTAPPTPENLPQVQEPKTAVLEESIPYQPLEQPDEEEGEILVGMGLYDTPDKFDQDVGLNNYRSTLSSLLSGNRGQGSPGKGLKLEETWEPPESDEDDDDDDDDDDEDDEKDAQEESS